MRCHRHGVVQQHALIFDAGIFNRRARTAPRPGLYEHDNRLSPNQRSCNNQLAMPCQQITNTGIVYNPPLSSRSGPFATEADCLNACKEGACCNGTTCSVKPQCQCQGTGQTFKGVGTTCDSLPGICCGPTIEGNVNGYLSSTGLVSLASAQSFPQCRPWLSTRSACEQQGGTWQTCVDCAEVDEKSGFAKRYVCAPPAPNPLP